MIKKLAKFLLLVLIFLPTLAYANNYTLPIDEPGDSDIVYFSWFDHDEDVGERMRYDGETVFEYDNHHGVDFATTIEGKEVYAVADGVVRADGWQNPSDFSEGYGYRIYLYHSDYSQRTLYAHATTTADFVDVNDMVGRGDVIILSGNTGQSSGPHLHFGVYDCDCTTSTEQVDPFGWQATTTDPWPYNTNSYLWTTNPPSMYDPGTPPSLASQYIAMGEGQFSNFGLSLFSVTSEGVTELLDNDPNVSTVRALDFHPTQKLFASGSASGGGGVSLWSYDNDTLTQLDVVSASTPMMGALKWSPNGKFLAYAQLFGNNVRIYELVGSELIIRDIQAFGEQANNISWSPDSQYLAVAQQNPDLVSLNSVSESGVLAEIEIYSASGDFLAVAFDRTGDYIAFSGGGSGGIGLLEFTTPNTLTLVDTVSTSGGYGKLKFSNDNRFLVKSVYENTTPGIVILDHTTPGTLSVADTQNFSFTAQSFDISADSKFIAVSSSPGISIFEVESDLTLTLVHEQTGIGQGDGIGFSSGEAVTPPPPSETLWATSHITGNFPSPGNALGLTDALWAGELNTNTDATSRWAMENPSVSREGTQTIEVLARKGSNSKNPTIQVNLYENGSFVETVIGETAITSTTGQTLSGTFDASVISNFNNVEIQIVMDAQTGSPNARNSAQVDSIKWEG